MDPKRDDIDAALVRRLVAGQFPQWAHLPVVPAEPNGWDNRTFRLGPELSVRLPSAAGYVAQVAKEHRWLPRLAPHLPLAIPFPIALGQPAHGYPWQWSIYRWLEGETAAVERIADLSEFATTLAGFLVALQQVDPTGGPPPGSHNFFRGAPPQVYDGETRRAIEQLDGLVDTGRATEVWETALESRWGGPPVWIHGDVAAGNLLTRAGRLAAVIDFGTSGVGDPACDLAIAWTLFSGKSRRAFRTAVALDPATWDRGRGWALWKALITLVEYAGTDQRQAEVARRVIGEVLADAA